MIQVCVRVRVQYIVVLVWQVEVLHSTSTIDKSIGTVCINMITNGKKNCGWKCVDFSFRSSSSGLVLRMMIRWFTRAAIELLFWTLMPPFKMMCSPFTILRRSWSGCPPWSLRQKVGRLLWLEIGRPSSACSGTYRRCLRSRRSPPWCGIQEP